MAQGDSILKKLCTENVYMDNVFHILGIGTNVTPRKLRRRREDIDAAHEFGGDSWNGQFKHLLGNCEVPTYQEVCDAFDRIENPEERIVSEFFWFWPTSDSDTSLDTLLEGHKSAAIEAWMDAVEDEIRQELAPGEELVSRFSPGYEDLPIAFQRTLLTILDTSRKIGVSLSDAYPRANDGNRGNGSNGRAGRP